MIGLGLGFNQGDIDKVKSQFNELTKQLENNGQIDFTVKTDTLKKDLADVSGTFDQVIAKYNDLGKIKNITPTYDNNGSLQSFVLQLKDAQGLIDKIRLSTEDVNNNPVFKVSGITEIDNTLKDQQSLLNAINQIEDRRLQTIKDREAEEQKVNDVQQKAIDDYQQEQRNNDILIEQEQKKLDLINRQWQTKIQGLRNNGAVPEANINAFEDNVNNTVSTGSLGQNDLKQQYQDLLSLQNQLNSAKQQELQTMKEVMTQGLNEKDQEQKAIQQEVDAQESLNKLQSDYLIKLKDIQTANKEAFSTIGLKQQATDFENLVKSQTTSTLNTNEVNTAWKNLSSNVKEANVNLKESNGIFGDLVHNFSEMAKWAVSGTAIFGSLQQLQQGISFINDLNKSMTNIQMITGMSSQQVQGLTKDYSDLAGQLHETTGSIMTASEEFLRAGNTAQETGDLLKASTVMSKLAGQSQADSAQSLISIMNAFHLKSQDMMGVVDKMVAVDNNAATSTAELSTALQKVSSSAANVGITLPQLISYIGTISSVTRESASTIGTSINSIISRYASIKEGKQFDPDNNPLNNVEKSLNRYGIAIRANATTFKSFSDVIQELSSKWKDYNDVQKNDISTQLAGTRQRNEFLTLMDNMNVAMGQQQVQAQSAGNAMQRYGTYAQSTEAKFNDLTNTMQKMWMSLINSSAINSAIGLLNNFVKGLSVVATSSDGTKGAIIALITATIALGLAIKSVGGISAISSVIANVGVQAAATATQEAILTSVSVGLTTAIKGIGTALLFLATTPIGLLITGLGLATAAVLHHVNTLKEQKQAVDDTSNAYKNLNQAIKDNSITSENADLQKLQKQQTDLTNALKARADAQKQLGDIAKAGNVDPYSSDIQRLTGIMVNANKTINDTENALNGAGVAYNKTTGAIYAVNQAQLQIQNNNIVKNIKDQAQAEIDNKNQIVGLIQEYQRLSQEENTNSGAKQRMSQIAEELGGKIAGLQTATDSQGNTVIKNTDLLGKEIQILTTEGNSVQTLTNVKLTAAKDDAQIQVGETTVTYNEAKKRIASIQTEIAAYQVKAQEAQKAADAIAHASGGKVTGMGGGSAYDSATSKINSDVDALNQLKNAMSELDKIYATNSGSDSINLPSQSDNNYMPSGDNSKSNNKQANAQLTAQSRDVANQSRDIAIQSRNLDMQTQTITNQENALDNQSRTLTNQSQALENQSQVLNIQKQQQETAMQNAEDARQQNFDAIIKGYQDQLDALKQKKQLQDDTNSLLKDENDLIKAQQDLQNAQNEKNVRVFSNGKWQWMADQSAVSKAQDNLVNVQQTVAQQKSDMAEKAQEDALSDKIKSTQDAKSADSQAYTNQKNALDQSYQQQQDNITLQKMNIQDQQNNISNEKANLDQQKQNIQNEKTNLDNAKNNVANQQNSINDSRNALTGYADGTDNAEPGVHWVKYCSVTRKLVA